MDIVNSFRDDFKLFKDTQKVARVFQVIPVVLYYYFIRYLYTMGQGKCSEYQPKKRKVLIITSGLFLLLHSTLLCIGHNSIISWLINNDALDIMGIVKVLLLIGMVMYLLSVIKYIDGLKRICREPYIIDNIMVTYSKITLVIYVIVILTSFYIINVLVQEEIKSLYK